jgi:hypothetical protein
MLTPSQRNQLEQQAEQLHTLMSKTNTRLIRLEEQRSLASGREQFQREDEIASFQSALERYQQQLRAIEEQLNPKPRATPQPSTTTPRVNVNIPFDLTYVIHGQTERGNGAFVVAV